MKKKKIYLSYAEGADAAADVPQIREFLAAMFQ